MKRLLFLFGLLFVCTHLSAQTIIDMGTGKVRGKTLNDYQQENKALLYRAAKDSVAYQSLIVRALNALHNDSLQQATSLLNTAIALRPDAPATSTLYHLLGQIALAEQHYGVAVERLSKALALNPDNHNARYEKATAEMEIGNYQSATDNCNVLLASKQTEYTQEQLLFLHGSIALRAHLYATARQDFTKILEQNPQARTAQLLLITTNFYDGHRQEAMDRLNVLLQQYPDFVDALHLRADLEMEQTQYEAALYDLDKAIALSPSNGTLYRKRAKALYASGKTKAAEQDLQKARQLP